jgi:hypothetical protein
MGIMKSRRMRWVEHAAYVGRNEKFIKMLFGKLERKKQLGRPKRA